MNDDQIFKFSINLLGLCIPLLLMGCNTTDRTRQPAQNAIETSSAITELPVKTEAITDFSKTFSVPVRDLERAGYGYGFQFDLPKGNTKIDVSDEDIITIRLSNQGYSNNSKKDLPAVTYKIKRALVQKGKNYHITFTPIEMISERNAKHPDPAPQNLVDIKNALHFASYGFETTIISQYPVSSVSANFNNSKPAKGHRYRFSKTHGQNRFTWFNAGHLGLGNFEARVKIEPYRNGSRIEVFGNISGSLVDPAGGPMNYKFVNVPVYNITDKQNEIIQYIRNVVHM